MKALKMFGITAVVALMSAIVVIAVGFFARHYWIGGNMRDFVSMFVYGPICWFLVGMPSHVTILARFPKMDFWRFMLHGLLAGVIFWFCSWSFDGFYASVGDGFDHSLAAFTFVFFLCPILVGYFVLWVALFHRIPSLTWTTRTKTSVAAWIVIPLILFVIFEIGQTKAARASSTSSCIGNLRQFDGAKEQAAMELKLSEGAMVTAKEADGFLKGGTQSIKCPHDPKRTFNTSYSLERIGSKPLCLINPGSHTL